MKARFTVGLLAFVGFAMSASAQPGSGRQDGFTPPIGQPGGDFPQVNQQQLFDQWRTTLTQTYGAEKVFSITIQIHGVKWPKGEDFLEMQKKHKPNYPVRPTGRAPTREEFEEFQRRRFMAQRAEEHEKHRTFWDMYLMKEVIQGRVQRFCREIPGEPNIATPTFFVPSGDGMTALIVVAPVKNGEELRKSLGMPNAALNGQAITASISRKDLPDAPVLPEDPMDLAGCGCVYLQVGSKLFETLGFQLLFKAKADPKRPEVARALAQFLQDTPQHGVNRDRAVTLLAHWATPEQTALLQDLARPDNATVSPEPKRLATLALRNLKQATASDPKGQASQPALPQNLDDATPEQLAAALPSASTSRRTELLERLEAGKGVSYTEALAEIISRLDAKAKKAARESLQRRLLRMTAKTLARYLEDYNKELILAAIGAIGEKKLAELTPALIKIVEAGDAETALAAHEALEKITGKTIKTPANSTAAEWKKIGGLWREMTRGLSRFPR